MRSVHSDRMGCGIEPRKEEFCGGRDARNRRRQHVRHRYARCRRSAGVEGHITSERTRKARIAHLAGPNATIQNTPPLVTSNKARAKHGLPLLTNPDGSLARFDVLRVQRLAAPVT